MSTSSSFTLQVPDGTGIHVYRWLPEGPVRAVVQIAHGIAEHAARYAHVAEALNERGYAVYADDHRGHGKTAASDDDLGFFAEERGWAKVLDDLYRLNRRIVEEHPDVPVFLMGHSMGSFFAQQYLFTFPATIHGLVLSGSTRLTAREAEAGAALARFEIRRQGPRGRSLLMTAAVNGLYNRPFEPSRTDFDWLSRDEDVVDAYVADPRCGFLVTNRLWLDVFSGLRVIRQVERLESVPPEMPIYAFSGERCAVGGFGAGFERLLDAYAEAGLYHVTSKLYPGGRHEMLNETNRDEVIADLGEWLDVTTDEVTSGVQG
jgi:alpha-beta hydrolase superfamily lysophospholipase